MKIVALGGSAAGTNTGAGCSGLLVSEGEASVVLDLGPGTLPELRKHVDYRSITAIVISHYHLDHVLDLGALRFLAKYNPKPMERTIKLWIPPGSAAKFATWTAAFGLDGEGPFLEAVFDIAVYDPDQSLTIGPASFRFAQTVHFVPTWAIRVAAAGSGDIGYTADTGPSADFGPFFNGVSLLIAEATESNDTAVPAETRGHLTAREAARLARTANAKALMLTHRWEELGLDRAAEEAGAHFDGPIMIARPGMTVFV